VKRRGSARHSRTIAALVDQRCRTSCRGRLAAKWRNPPDLNLVCWGHMIVQFTESDILTPHAIVFHATVLVQSSTRGAFYLLSSYAFIKIKLESCHLLLRVD